MADPYLDGTCDWWHLSGPSPELRQAHADGWLPRAGRGLDVGCGRGQELGYLAQIGLHAVGVELSTAAAVQAQTEFPGVLVIRADVRRLPFVDKTFDLALDRGCFHYLRAAHRGQYEQELRRVLKPGGRLLLRACMRTASRCNGVDEAIVRSVFAAWRIVTLEMQEIPSDTRRMDALVVRLERPQLVER